MAHKLSNVEAKDQQGFCDVPRLMDGASPGFSAKDAIMIKNLTRPTRDEV